MSETQSFTCIFCKDSFTDKEIYQTHFRQHGDPNLHSRIKSAKKQSQDTAAEGDVNVKIKSENPEMVGCDVCTETFPTISKAITHKHKAHPNHDAKYFCPWCGKLFTMKHLYNKHLTSHNAGVTNDETFFCDYCQVNFYNPVAVLYHNKFFHREDPDTPSIGSSKKRKLVNDKLMVLHYCCFCGDEYINRVNLQKHMTDDHSDENQCPDEVYRCPLCDAIFYHLDAYEIHLTFHSDNDNYGSLQEIITSELVEFNLETVPPKIEKVENYDEDPENNISSIGIDQFLQLAMDTNTMNTVENEDEQSKPHKKHKKHKKSKKAITLDQFLNMNKDVFGECLDVQGVEEVPSQVVTKQLRVNKPKMQPVLKPVTKVISKANLEKLKQQGIVVKMKSTNKTVPVLPGMKIPIASKEIKKQSDQKSTTKGVLSKIISQPNSEIKIMKKPVTIMNNDEIAPDIKVQPKNMIQENDDTHDSGRESDNETESCKQVTTDDENIDKNNTENNGIDEIKINSEKPLMVPKDLGIQSQVKATSESKQSLSVLKSLGQGITVKTINSSCNLSKRDEENIEKEEVKTNIFHKSEANNAVSPLQKNSNLEAKQTFTALKNLSQQITIKSLNKNSDSNKPTENLRGENVRKSNASKDEIIHIDNDEEDEKNVIHKNTNVQSNDKDATTNYGSSDPTENTVSNMIVKFNKNKNMFCDTTDEEENTESNSVVNSEHDATLDKIKKLSHNISIKSMQESKNLTVKSSNSSRIVNVAQCVKTVKVENYNSHFKQVLESKRKSNMASHLHNMPKPKTADSLKVIDSFKEINFTDDDDDDDVFNNDIKKIITYQDSAKKNMLNIKKSKNELTPKVITKSIPIEKSTGIQNEFEHFDSNDEFSDNSNIDSDKEYLSDHANSEFDESIKKTNRNVIEKLKNTNISIKSINDRPAIAKVVNKPKQIIASPKVLSKISNQNRNVKAMCIDYEDIDESFRKESIQFSENETSDEELHQSVSDKIAHQATMKKLLNTNKALSIKPWSQNKPNEKISTNPSTIINENEEKSTTLINNLKTSNKGLVVKQANQRETKSNPHTPENNDSSDSPSKPFKPVPLSCKIRNSNQQLKTSSDIPNKSNQLMHSKSCNQELATSSQAQTVKQEVTVKTVQTKTETVVEEITTTVTKTVKTINQTQTVNQEMSSVVSGNQEKSNCEGINMIGKNVQRSQQEGRPQIKYIKNCNPETKMKPVAQPRMVRPSVSNPINVTNRAVAVRPNMNQMRPRNPCPKIMPGQSSQQQTNASKPLKISPNVIRQQPKIVNKMPVFDNIGSHNFIKRQRESVSNIDNIMSDEEAEDVISSHMSRSQQSTSKVVKAGAVVASHHSQVSSSLSHQLTRLGNNSGLKIVKTSTKTCNEFQQSEMSPSKRTALDAIEKLQKQGLLVKKPRMDVDSDNMSGSGCDSDDPQDHYLQENSD